MIEIARHRVLDTPVDGVDMQMALDFVKEAVQTRSSPGFILAVNPEKVFVLREDAFLRESKYSLRMSAVSYPPTWGFAARRPRWTRRIDRYC